MKKPQIKVIFRKNHDVIEAFFPELPANIGKIACYAHIGQHGEAAIGYYLHTEAAAPAEYKPLLEELQQVYADCTLIIRKKLYRNELNWR